MVLGELTSIVDTGAALNNGQVRLYLRAATPSPVLTQRMLLPVPQNLPFFRPQGIRTAHPPIEHTHKKHKFCTRNVFPSLDVRQERGVMCLVSAVAVAAGFETASEMFETGPVR
eukprot:1575355-Rhodomonas_salina.1